MYCVWGFLTDIAVADFANGGTQHVVEIQKLGKLIEEERRGINKKTT